MDTGGDQPLGILPHQIRGSLSQFSQMTLVGYASANCTACSSSVRDTRSQLRKSFCYRQLDGFILSYIVVLWFVFRVEGIVVALFFILFIEEHDYSCIGT